MFLSCQVWIQTLTSGAWGPRSFRKKKHHDERLACVYLKGGGADMLPSCKLPLHCFHCFQLSTWKHISLIVFKELPTLAVLKCSNVRTRALGVSLQCSAVGFSDCQGVDGLGTWEAEIRQCNHCLREFYKWMIPEQFAQNWRRHSALFFFSNFEHVSMRRRSFHIRTRFPKIITYSPQK